MKFKAPLINLESFWWFDEGGHFWANLGWPKSDRVQATFQGDVLDGFQGFIKKYQFCMGGPQKVKGFRQTLGGMYWTVFKV